MRRNFWVGLAAIGLAGVMIGCVPPPDRTQRVPTSALPASARAQLAPEAEVYRVQEQHYGQDVIYRIWYRLDGKERCVDISTADETKPHAVFE